MKYSIIRSNIKLETKNQMIQVSKTELRGLNAGDELNYVSKIIQKQQFQTFYKTLLIILQVDRIGCKSARMSIHCYHNKQF
jgi:hypothetical protein